MSKRTVCLILGLFLLSYIPATDFFEEPDESFGTYMDGTTERIEISPNPNSITDLGAPIITDSFESTRSENADSSIGVFTHSGLIPSIYFSEDLAATRVDLALVIIDGNTGLWDARMGIMEINGLEIRSTIPPSGYLVQGTEEQLNELKNIQSVESIHYVPAGLMVHSSLYDAPADQILVVEITGWKNSDLVRQLEALDSNLATFEQVQEA